MVFSVFIFNNFEQHTPIYCMLNDMMLGERVIIGGIKGILLLMSSSDEEKEVDCIILVFFICLKFSIIKNFYKLRPYYKLNIYVDVYSQNLIVLKI